jgi:hypothetical protein
VVPVARVAYAFTGGFGAGKASAESDWQGGGGGGGAVCAFPTGALEITDQGTRFVPFIDVQWLVRPDLEPTALRDVAGSALAGLAASPRVIRYHTACAG